MNRYTYSEPDEARLSKPKQPIKTHPDVSMFGQSSGLADVTLIVEGVRIPVIKALLSLTSPVFRAMFGGEWKEKFQNEIPLPGKRVDSFLPFLRCIYPDLMDRVTAETATGILQLAWEYQIVKLSEQCEDCLLQWIGDLKNINMPCDALCSCLKMAEICNRSRLKEECCLRISTFTLNERTSSTEENKISAASIIEISKMACKRHELFKMDIRSCATDWFHGYMVNLPQNSAYISKTAINFRALRLSHFFCGRSYPEYMQALTKLRSNCPQYEVPKYSEFDFLHHDLKYDIQQIMPSFKKQ